MGTALISIAYTVINNLFRIEQPWSVKAILFIMLLFYLFILCRVFRR